MRTHTLRSFELNRRAVHQFRDESARVPPTRVDALINKKYLRSTAQFALPTILEIHARPSIYRIYDLLAFLAMRRTCAHPRDRDAIFFFAWNC